MGCQEVHQYPHESHRSPSQQLATIPCICLLPFECHSLTSLDGITPLQALTGQVPDISHFLHSLSGNLFTTR